MSKKHRSPLEPTGVREAAVELYKSKRLKSEDRAILLDLIDEFDLLKGDVCDAERRIAGQMVALKKWASHGLAIHDRVVRLEFQCETLTRMLLDSLERKENDVYHSG